jgi:triacylglycerol esterase/lipase EstA (alpha/beta hydrolase family)
MGVGRRSALGVLVVVTAVACGSPGVGVRHLDPRAVHRHLTRNVLSADALSTTTTNVLYRRNLTERFDDDPDRALLALHEIAVGERGRRGDLWALAELNFFRAERTGDVGRHLAAAIYAYAFLVPHDPSDLVDPLDPRLRSAADVYNRALARGLATKPGHVEPRALSWQLPFGSLDVAFDPQELVWGRRRLTRFVPVAELEVKGLATRYRVPGLGASLAASTDPLDPMAGFDDFVEPWIRVPVTALLRFDDVHAQLASGRLHGRLTLERTQDRPHVDVDGRAMPLEVENTSSLALMLAESPVWQREVGGFLQRAGLIDDKTRLAALAPYTPGKLPVVLVHGTASSPGRWAQMINELSNDRAIGPHVSFWLFMYDTGNPIAYSAMLLRESLVAAVAKLDPEGKDPALRRMVVVGHSQGGLLTKLTVVDSGDRFFRNVSEQPLEKLDLDEDQRAFVRRLAFVTPLPFVRRVIFLATPHRGSYVAGNWLAHQVARLIVLPFDITHRLTDILRRNPSLQGAGGRRRFQTSVDNMTPGNRFITTLASLPIQPPVVAHSIIAVQGDGPAGEGDDGVVEFESARIDGVASTTVVRSAHSCQDHPQTIDKVREILLEHIEEP